MVRRSTNFVLSRLATVGLAAVLLFLAGFATWSSITSQHAAQRLRNARLLSNAFEQTLFAMDSERLVEHEYLVGHGGDFLPAASNGMHVRFDAEATNVVDGLANIDRLGEAQDRVLVRQLSTEQRAYHHSMDGVFGAAMTNQNGAAQMHGMFADQAFWRLRDEMTTASKRHNASAVRQLNDLQNTEATIQAATWPVIAAALALVAMFALIMRSYRRREQALTRAELTRLEQQALIDNLTQLRNNRAFEEDLERDVARIARTGEPIALGLLDLDCLKQTNDSRGHQAGDERLKALAQAMTRALRQGDGSYRLSGDEFALILACTRARDGVEVVERVQVALAQLGGGGVSAGIAEAGPGVDRDELIRNADVALIEAKRSHQPVLVYSPEMNESGDQRERLVELKTVAAALAQAVDAKDSLTRKHSETVAELCAAIASELGLERRRVSELRLAGLLHDVGKIGIPDVILSKPGPLRGEEFDVMKTHSVLGHGIVDALGLHQHADWILHHHERLDGKGYPDGLVESQIPLESRIILVADAFEAMTGERRYRVARSQAIAIAELRRHAGTQFDAACVAALETALAGRRIGLVLAASSG
jgi:diguanylate cyclase (GGDEF)-like protein/putative nucleotidyltransferase with HDIG domain